MPYKSKAQQRMFHYLQSKGKLPKKVVSEYDDSTDFEDLPERMFSGGRVGDEDVMPEDYAYGHFKVFDSSGEPDTDDDMEEGHSMEYMSDGGMVPHMQKGTKKLKKNMQGNIVRAAFSKAIARSKGMK